jgi:hypothetical protein
MRGITILLLLLSLFLFKAEAQSGIVGEYSCNYDKGVQCYLRLNPDSTFFNYCSQACIFSTDLHEPGTRGRYLISADSIILNFEEGISHCSNCYTSDSTYYPLGENGLFQMKHKVFRKCDTIIGDPPHTSILYLHHNRIYANKSGSNYLHEYRKHEEPQNIYWGYDLERKLNKYLYLNQYPE